MNVVTSELTKIRTLRSTMWTLIAMVGVLIGTALLVALTGSLHPGETVVAAALGNSAVGLVAAGAFGALAMATEYTSGTIRTTCTACPERGLVFAAKALVTAVVVGVVALVAAVAAFGAAAALLDRAEHPLGEPIPALLGAAACHVATALLGLALATALRSAVGGITAIAALLLLPTMFGPLLGDAEPWITGATPTTALQKLAAPTEGTWPTLTLVATYTAAALAAAVAAFRTRDV
ncbi:ABC transporter permease [Cryptosporangium sp. NPDC048952]|uniref:ABC transporter permease n=1 Tax=Cryptosporangium sp. NPDC048952 TaxID=3363961 RepID=UPI00371F6B51